MKNIPRVDLADFLSNDPTQKAVFISTLGEAFEEIGFVILKGHYLTEEHTKILYREIKKFFALPEEIKSGYEIEGMAGQRGYTAFGKESAKGKKEGDLKEFWHFGQYNIPTTGPMYPENVLVKEVPEFNAIGKEVFQLLEKTGRSVLQAIALHLKLEEDYFDHFVSYGTEAGQFQDAGYSAVVCGPGDIAQAHQPNEFIEVAQLEAGHKFMRKLLSVLR